MAPGRGVPAEAECPDAQVETNVGGGRVGRRCGTNAQGTTKPAVTFSAHFLMTVASSETTRSTHFKLGSLSFTICFFTMASKAMSGVKSPVLGHMRRAGRGRKTPGDSAGHTRGAGDREREERRVSWLVTCKEEPVPAFAPKLLRIKEESWVGVGGWGSPDRLGGQCRCSCVPTAKGTGRPGIFIPGTMASGMKISTPARFFSLSLFYSKKLKKQM